MRKHRNAPARWLFCGSVALLTAALVASAPVATGVGEDVTSPTTRMQASVVVGSTIGPSNLRDDRDPGNSCGPGGTNNWTTVAYRVQYSATDPSDVFHYDRWRVYAGAYPDYLGYYFSDEQSRFVDRLSDDHGDCGGGSLQPVGWAVTAYDGADNAKYVEVGRRPYVVQENGHFASAPPDVPVITLSSGWRSSTCACASGGRQVFSSQAGATATIRLADGGDVALVMATGPGRGRAAVVVDGAQVDTVDTRAPANVNRVVVWSETLSPGVAHVVKIKNLGTAGRSRIDFDALVL